MNKNDYVHLLKEACGGKCNAEYNPCAYRQAADSLAALKPVAWIKRPEKVGYKSVKLTFDPQEDDVSTPLYALEVTK
jgi:hypothetical protein